TLVIPSAGTTAPPGTVISRSRLRSVPTQRCALKAPRDRPGLAIFLKNATAPSGVAIRKLASRATTQSPSSPSVIVLMCMSPESPRGPLTGPRSGGRAASELRFLADPDGLEGAVDVAAEDGADVSVAVTVLDQPAADVAEVLGGVLQAVHVGHRVEGRAT